MPFNGSGIWTPPAADFPAVSGTLILATHFNNNMNDVATAFDNCVTRDGQSPATASLPMGGFRHINVADGSVRTSPTAHYASLGQMQDGTIWWGGTVGGTADALTLTLAPALPAYVAGQRFVAKAGASPNTGAATIAVNGLAAKALQVGGAALTAGLIAANQWYEFLYDGAAFQVSSIGGAIAQANNWTGINTFVDGSFKILGSADGTKKLKFEVDGFTTGTERTLTPQDVSGTIALITEFAYSGLPSSSGRLLLPNDYISGFTLTNNGATGFDVAAGQAMDSTNGSNIIGSAIANKSQSAWAAGAAAGGKLSAAAMVANTWYYWFAIWKTADGTVDYGFDAATTPTFPGGYTKYRYLGARKTQAASTNWDNFIQHGDDVTWTTPPVLDFTDTNPGTVAVTKVLNVPLGIKVLAKFNFSLVNNDATGGTSTTAYISAIETSDLASGAGGTTPLGSLTCVSNSTVGIATGTFSQWVNTSSQIRYRLSGSSANIQVRANAIGWIDPRGKPV